MKKILLFGEILLRLESFGYNRILQNDILKASFCGAEANVAVSLANFNERVKFVTKLPNNCIGLAAIRNLQSFGIDISNCILTDGRLGIFFLEKGISQRPSKIIYDRKNSCIALSQVEDFNWEQLFHNVKWFHWTGITPALSENLYQILIEACKIAKEKGIFISCDLNYRATLWSENDALCKMDSLMKFVDLCIGNEEDAEKMLGIKNSNISIEKNQFDINAYIKSAKKICQKYTCKYVAFTLRKNYSANFNRWQGIFYDKQTQKFYLSKEYDIQIVDRVGAGDSFAAGIIYGLINMQDYQKIIDFAVAASCLKHTIDGDFNRVCINEINELIDNNNSRIRR